MSSRTHCLVVASNNGDSLYCFRAQQLLFSMIGDWLLTTDSGPDGRSGKLLLALASTVILGSESHRTHDYSAVSWLQETCIFCCYCVWVGSGKLLLPLASAVILCSESHRTHDNILLSHDSGSHATVICVTSHSGQSHKFMLAPCQYSDSCFQVPQDSWPYFTVSWPWSHWSSLYNFGMDRIDSTASNSSCIVVCIFVAMETCLPSCFLSVDVSSGSTVSAFRRHVTVH
jgi:hypothetical protein